MCVLHFKYVFYMNTINFKMLKDAAEKLRKLIFAAIDNNVNH